jgi:hypothetical protein
VDPPPDTLAAATGNSLRSERASLDGFVVFHQ